MIPLIILLLVLAVSFGLTALLVWVGSLILPYTFSWLIVLGVWLLIATLKTIFGK